MAFPLVQLNCWCLRTQRNNNWETLCFSQISNSQSILGKELYNRNDFPTYLYNKSFPLRFTFYLFNGNIFCSPLGLHTTPKAPLPTTWVKSKQKKTHENQKQIDPAQHIMLKQTWKVKEDFRNHHDLDLPQSQYEFSLIQGDNERHCLCLWKFIV